MTEQDTQDLELADFEYEDEEEPSTATALRSTLDRFALQVLKAERKHPPTFADQLRSSWTILTFILIQLVVVTGSYFTLQANVSNLTSKMAGLEAKLEGLTVLNANLASQVARVQAIERELEALKRDFASRVSRLEDWSYQARRGNAKR